MNNKIVQRPASIHEEHAAEAARAAQRYLDQVAEITHLTHDCDGWRQRALAAEARCKQHEEQHESLCDLLERRTEELTHERDNYKLRLTQIVGQFHAAGNIILKCLQAADTIIEQPKIDMHKLLVEIEQSSEDHETQEPQQESTAPGDR